MAHQPVEVRPWSQHEVVVIRHDFAVIALAHNLPEPFAHLTRLTAIQTCVYRQACRHANALTRFRVNRAPGTSG